MKQIIKEIAEMIGIYFILFCVLFTVTLFSLDFLGKISVVFK